ncbi:hypothetical protein HNR06_002284 [Nocardiopsis arvandica]|uniref:DUF4383 domain-containing protein n=1 Tax=Nocardiopsis sinuspersici TaxID=501010 RepID=A0A7Z0BK24_9ACTN|nr:DUF4383 domain-containing protein [Nocardiopsis sinuspersici]NYH52695.1 hypothetical protein [Nocardiopsis sinuspersici]
MSKGMPTQGETRVPGKPIRVAALVYGVVFLLVGLLGFIPGVTTNYGQMQFAGHESEAFLLGIFQVSILHNLLHLVLGAAGVAMARTASAAKAFLVGGGFLYLLLWFYGLLVDNEDPTNIVPLNDADNWLHLVLALTMVGLGFILAPSRGARR